MYSLKTWHRLLLYFSEKVTAVNNHFKAVKSLGFFKDVLCVCLCACVHACVYKTFLFYIMKDITDRKSYKSFHFSITWRSDLFAEFMALSDGHKDIIHHDHQQQHFRRSFMQWSVFSAINLSRPLQVYTSVDKWKHGLTVFLIYYLFKSSRQIMTCLYNIFATINYLHIDDRPLPCVNTPLHN